MTAPSTFTLMPFCWSCVYYYFRLFWLIPISIRAPIAKICIIALNRTLFQKSKICKSFLHRAFWATGSCSVEFESVVFLPLQTVFPDSVEQAKISKIYYSNRTNVLYCFMLGWMHFPLQFTGVLDF